MAKNRNKYHVGVITAEELRKFEQNARRGKRLEMETRSGGGIHGGGPRAKNRAERRDGKRQTRNWED